MLIIRDKSRIPEDCYGSVIALGNFDGLHLGHQVVIGKAISIARRTGRKAAVLTFEPNPRRVFKPDLPVLRIIPFHEKAHRLKEMGVDFLRVIRFTRDFAKTTAEQFIDDILLSQLHVSHVITGNDFIFGHNREGNVEYMQKMAAAKGFGYTVCGQVMAGDGRCSSTRVRELLVRGAVDEVSGLLGKPYSMTAIVRSGDKRGRQLGFPTANLLPGRIFTPARGVYAVKVNVRGKTADGVANLGIRPTFGGERFQLEVHIFDWNEDIYGKHMEVQFIGYIRSEKKFEGIEALKKQISEDCERAKKILEL